MKKIVLILSFVYIFQLLSCSNSIGENIENDVKTTFTVYGEKPEDSVNPNCISLSYTIGKTVYASNIISSASSIAKTGYSISEIGYYCNPFISLDKSDELPDFVRTYDGTVDSAIISIDVKLDGAALYVMTWAENSYTVVFDSNGGSGTISDEEFTYEQSKALYSNSFSKNGYTLASPCWNTSPSGNGTAYSDGEVVSKLTGKNGGVVTLYAQWEPLGCVYEIDDGLTVTYSVDGSSMTFSSGMSGTWLLGKDSLSSSSSSCTITYSSLGSGKYTLYFISDSGLKFLHASFSI